MTHPINYAQLFTTHQKKLLADYYQFLQFPTISADPSYRKDLQRCANWLKQYLQNAGFAVELWNEKDAPIVFASHTNIPNAPTLLLYNHYDVQPVDPLNLWKHDPFTPHKEDHEVYARGAQDNKGQCFYVLAALTLYLQAHHSFPLNIKWIIEGEEESGSHGLAKILREKKEALACDYLMVVDLGMRNKDIPAITLGTRGLTSLEIDLQGTTGDLHSGMHGGLAYNPLHALVEILAKLRDKNGKVLVPGFYDDVEMPTLPELKKINFTFDEQEYTTRFGRPPTGGENRFPALERNWLRPTLEINGLGGGYQGPGGKTVIPAKAHAKISCRLVPNQDPQKIAMQVKNYLLTAVPPGIEVQVTIHEGMGRPVRTKSDSTIVKALDAACKDVWKVSPEYILEGASIPVISDLDEVLRSEIAMFGLGLPSDNIHAPNEHFGWDRIEKGFLTICKLLDQIAKS